MSRFHLTIISAIVVSLLAGCGSSHRTDEVGAEGPATQKEKIRSEAYLFDARVKRQGKPTSVRLEFYHTDSVVAFSGRGYLGKGALRGKLTADSLYVYFPSTNEYLFESVAAVLGSADCTSPLPSISLLALLNNLPDSVLGGSGLAVKSDYSDKKKPEFIVRSKHCKWEMRLTYALQKKGWRIKNFQFDDGRGATMKGKRRTYKKDKKIKASKFEVPLKPNSRRIIL